MKRTVLALTLICAMLSNALAQQPAAPSATASPSPSQDPAPAASPGPSPPLPSPSPAANEPVIRAEDVVRITTNLLQLDVTVTDKSGKQVRDLKAEDFEIFESGKPRTITNFSYVDTTSVPASEPSPTPTPRKDKESSIAPITPPRKLRPDQVRRAIALVVDDLRMSAESVHFARNSLRKYVDQQVQPGDLVAIIRTSAGIGALQQFTGDKQQLYAAIERVRMVARSGQKFGAFTSVNMLDRLENQTTNSLLADAGENESPTAQRRREQGITGDSTTSTVLSEYRDTLFTVGTLGALNFVVRGLKELPGRKAVVLLSDGISIFNANSSGEDRNERVLAALRTVVDNANRASVVFYTLDARGIQPDSFTAADSTSGEPIPPTGSGPPGSRLSGIQPDMAGTVFSSRSGEMFEGQNGLNYLARETGGLSLFNSNDLNKGIRNALEDIGGYYLIGYRPDENTFDSKGQPRFTSWTVKVKNRDDLRVRTRRGFVNVADENAPAKTRAQQLMSALLSPFASSGVKLVLSSFFLNDSTLGSAMRSVLLMDTKNISFKPLPDGQMEATIDIVGVTLGEEGQVVDQVSRVETIRAKPEMVARFEREGMIYGMNVPVSKPGAYQLRVAVRDHATGQVGSASQYIEVPQVGKDRLQLSSLVISGNKQSAPSGSGTDLLKAVLGKSRTAPTTSATSAPTAVVVPGGEGMLGTEDAEAGPASRRFRHGMLLDYACIIYNGKSSLKKGPKITTQVRLFQGEKEVFVGQIRNVDAAGQPDMSRLVVARRLQLGTILDPGEYVLHLTVKDAATAGDKGVATRWIDFEIVK